MTPDLYCLGDLEYLKTPLRNNSEKSLENSCSFLMIPDPFVTDYLEVVCFSLRYTL